MSENKSNKVKELKALISDYYNMLNAENYKSSYHAAQDHCEQLEKELASLDRFAYLQLKIEGLVDYIYCQEHTKVTMSAKRELEGLHKERDALKDNAKQAA